MRKGLKRLRTPLAVLGAGVTIAALLLRAKPAPEVSKRVFVIMPDNISETGKPGSLNDIVNKSGILK